MAQAIGHLNSSFVIACKLRSAGNRVVYCGGRECELIVKSRGFEYSLIEIQSLLPDAVELKTKGFVFFLECFFSLFTKARQQIFYQKTAGFEDVIREIAPDFVFLDIQSSMHAILYHHLCIPFTYIEILPLSLYDPWVPPFTSKYIPQKTILSRLRIFLDWQNIVWKRKSRMRLYAIFLFGQDYYSLIHKQAIRYDFRNKLDIKRSFVVSFKGINILSMTPSCFDFPRKYSTNCYFAESRVDFNRENLIIDKRYLMVMEMIRLQKKQDIDKRIIYCSMGTVTQGFYRRIEMFFKKIRKVSMSNQRNIFIISIGMEYDATKLLPHPPNMYIFQRVPQLDMLSQCDLMITHGGINSIEECIKMEIPMLVFPLSLKWDQPGNSARVVYHGLGLRADIQRDSPENIENKIDQIMQDYSYFKQNLSMMNEKMSATDRNAPSWWSLLQF